MKSKCAVLAIMAVVIVTVPAVMAACSSDSDASPSYDKYYYQQLTPDQKIIYDKLSGLDVGSIANDAQGYYYSVSITDTINLIYSTSDETTVRAEIAKDAARAWEASKLDNPMAFWTWRVGSDMPDLSISAVTATGGTPNCVTAYTVRINMDSAYAEGIADKLAACKSLIDGFTVNGTTSYDKVDSINSALLGKGYKVAEGDKIGKHSYSLYGATVKTDDVSYLTAEGYAVLFKAICDKVGISCIQVYGTYAGDSNCTHAWNEVIIEDTVYGCDSASDSKAGNSGWILSGVYTQCDGKYYSNAHRGFVFAYGSGMDYDFNAELPVGDGYSWPEDTSIIAVLANYAPWILVGIICVILAASIIIMARNSD